MAFGFLFILLPLYFRIDVDVAGRDQPVVAACGRSLWSQPVVAACIHSAHHRGVTVVSKAVRHNLVDLVVCLSFWASPCPPAFILFLEKCIRNLQFSISIRYIFYSVSYTL